MILVHQQEWGTLKLPLQRGSEKLEHSFEIWKFVLNLANQKQEVMTTKRSISCNGDWDAARPCSICGRDKDDYCLINTAGDAILCKEVILVILRVWI